MLAEPAFPAVGLYVDRYPVTGLYRMNLLPYFGDNADHFVADGDSLNGTRNTAVLDMQVTGADACKSDFHYCVFRIQDFRLRLIKKGEAALVYVCVCFHLMDHRATALLWPRCDIPA